MAKVDLKILLDDVRARDAALLSMLLTTDRQAMALFRVYVPLAAALVSAALAATFKVYWYLDGWIATGAGSAALVLALACWYCIQAMKTATVAVPGKGAEFWQWATRDDIDEDVALAAYLDQSLKGQDNNFKVNRRSSNCLRMAKRLGVASIILGSGIVLVGTSGLAAIAWEAWSRL